MLHFLVIVGNENGEPVIPERQIRIMDKPVGHRDLDDGMSYVTQFNSTQFHSYNRVVVVNLYLTRVIPSEYVKVYLLSIGALN